MRFKWLFGLHVKILLIITLIFLHICLIWVVLDTRTPIQASSNVLSLCRRLLSGSQFSVETEESAQENDEHNASEPLYLHYVRFLAENSTTTRISFLDYLSILSAVQHLKPDGIFLHGDAEPVGDYWAKVKASGWVTYVNQAKITHLKGRIGTPRYIQHMADVTKLDILIKYGGVAADFDIYFVRGERIRAILQDYSAMTCYGDALGYSIGLIGFTKNSGMLRAFRRSYDIIYTPEWNFNSGDVLKFLSEVYEEEVYVVDQVCNNPHPHPEIMRNFFLHTGRLNWTDSVAIHTYHRYVWGEELPEITGPGELAAAPTSTFKELLLTIYENRTLPMEDPTFVDRIGPLAGIGDLWGL